jgi:hypothetical protein
MESHLLPDKNHIVGFHKGRTERNKGRAIRAVANLVNEASSLQLCRKTCSFHTPFNYISENKIGPYSQCQFM